MDSRLECTRVNFVQVSVSVSRPEVQGLGSVADPQGGRPLDWGQKKFLTPPKKFIARPKHTGICKPPFACQNVLKLTYSNLEFQNFPGEDYRTPSSRGGEGRGREGRRGQGKGKERRERKDREGRGGTGLPSQGEGRASLPCPFPTGRDMGGEEWGVGRGGEGRSTWAPPPRDKLWIRPCLGLGLKTACLVPTPVARLP